MREIAVYMFFSLIAFLFGVSLGYFLCKDRSAIHSWLRDLKDSTYTYYSIFCSPAKIDGFAFLDKSKGMLTRLTNDKSYSIAIRQHINSAAGGRIRFSTDSTSIKIKVWLHKPSPPSWMTLCSSSGLDIYEHTINEKKWIGIVSPKNTNGKYYSGVVCSRYSGMRDIVIYLPQYCGIKTIKIGVLENTAMNPPQIAYTTKTPIVFYGSSITQGASSSRAGTSFPALVANYFNSDYLNFGFSGAAKGEQAVAHAIANCEMSAFIMEYDHNAESADYLSKTHFTFYTTIRAAHATIPIIMISRLSGGYSISDDEARERACIIMNTYKKAVAGGDMNVYFVDGYRLTPLGTECYFTDFSHPNDMGMRMIANEIIKILAKCDLEKTNI